MKSSSLIYSLLLISEPFLSGDLFLLLAWSLPVFSIVTSTKKEKNNFYPRFFTFQHQNKKQVSPYTSLRQNLSHFKHPSMPRVLPCIEPKQQLIQLSQHSAHFVFAVHCPTSIPIMKKRIKTDLAVLLSSILEKGRIMLIFFWIETLLLNVWQKVKVKVKIISKKKNLILMN